MAFRNRWDLVVFDWDGTLMDSVPRIVACLQAAAIDAGLPIPSPDRAKGIIGLGLKEAILGLYPSADKDLIKRFTAAYRDHFLEKSTVAETLFEDVIEVLESLRGRRINLAVATGKSRAGLDRVLTRFSLGEYFAATRCADETASKPAPQMLHEIMLTIGVNAGATLMVGDSQYDMQMAQAAGTDAMAITRGVLNRAQLSQFETVACIDELKELLRLIEA